MKNISEPTIYLYLYDLKQALGDDCQKYERRFEDFLEKLPDQLADVLRDQKKKDLEFNLAFDSKEYHELYSEGEGFFDILPPDDKKRTGWYYPVSIFDTYALLVNLSIDGSDEVVQPFKTLKQELEQHINHQTGTLGQTWKLSGFLPQTEGETVISAEKLKKYYKEFSNEKCKKEECAKKDDKESSPENKWQQDYFGEGIFLGSPIFELNLTQNNHTIITFFSEKEAYETDNNEYYDDWIRLFSFRHKIIWLYQTIEAISNQTQALYTDLEKIRTFLDQGSLEKENLKVLRNTLKRAQNLQGQYREKLYNIKFLKKAIEINLENYRERLQLIESKANQKSNNGQHRQTDLSFLNKFAERVENKFLRQTNKNYKFLKLGLNFLESQMSDIRDRLAVERAERDRNFQDIIVIAGAGWAVGSLVQSVEFGKAEVGYRPLFPKSLTNSWSDPTGQFVYAIASAVLSAVVVGLVIYILRNKTYKK